MTMKGRQQSKEWRNDSGAHLTGKVPGVVQRGGGLALLVGRPDARHVGSEWHGAVGYILVLQLHAYSMIVIINTIPQSPRQVTATHKGTLTGGVWLLQINRLNACSPHTSWLPSTVMKAAGHSSASAVSADSDA